MQGKLKSYEYGLFQLRIFSEEGASTRILVDRVHPLGVTANRSGLVAYTAKGKRKSGTVHVSYGYIVNVDGKITVFY